MFPAECGCGGDRQPHLLPPGAENDKPKALHHNTASPCDELDLMWSRREHLTVTGSLNQLFIA